LNDPFELPSLQEIQGMDIQRSQAIESLEILMIREDTCTVCYCEGGVADGAMEVAGGGGDVDVDGGASPPVVIFVPDGVVAFDGFTVTGIPHILDSVVLTGLSFDAGLLGLHIASFCSGVNDEAFT
jgi:hypothetical protein